MAGALRFVGALLFRALTVTPRRQLNLARWTRSREFRHLHGVSVAWLDSHFESIERGAPWLHRVGSDVWDFCKGGVQPFFRLSGGFSAGASCIREVTAVYGFDGPLTPRLRSLDQAMPPAGWEMGTRALRQTWTDLFVQAEQAGQRPSACSASPASRRSPAPCRPSGTTGPAYSATYRYEIQISNDLGAACLE